MTSALGAIAGKMMWQVLRCEKATELVTHHAITWLGTDLITGAIAQTTIETSLNVILTGYASREIDGVRILAGDQKCFALATDLRAPVSLRDRMLVRSVTWEIIDIRETAGGSILIMQLRRFGGTP